MLPVVILTVCGLPFPLLPGHNIDIIKKKEGKGDKGPFEMPQV
jgi:hypothetical protein